METITADELQQSGAATSVQEALKGIVPQFMGSGNRGAESATLGANTGHDYGGGSAIALRGLSTLILINGRRAAVSPIAAHGGGNEFVDLNIIPLFAVRSVEILRDGGSAAYGTDAIGGVVNLTTRAWRGAEVSAVSIKRRRTTADGKIAGQISHLDMLESGQAF